MLEQRLAQVSDTPVICALVNAAYRGETSRAGWTTEADLLTGVRTSERTIQALIESEHACILLGEEVGGVVAACICLEQNPESLETVHLGMIAVSPLLQNLGYGKTMILAAEKLAKAQWQAQRAEMMVISLREALIAFYRRLGYQPTGKTVPFPHQPDMWQAQVEDMQLIALQKVL
ncbi:MAG: GNAT family N-acetyltransferase [Methylophilus sp.]|uniref:GNAT family N-acetyltransferase n=1 Tax=Methylophilus sp. TaxID=29541 RepID=UPI002CE3AEBC|nr:GNAT family N-acetyltransferase [Methylophilus sp.]HSH87573.1 GNAT family N-acetyltransferase [Methylophilus sp.]